MATAVRNDFITFLSHTLSQVGVAGSEITIHSGFDSAQIFQMFCMTKSFLLE